MLLAPKISSFMHGFKSAILAIFHFFQNDMVRPGSGTGWKGKVEVACIFAI